MGATSAKRRVRSSWARIGIALASAAVTLVMLEAACQAWLQWFATQEQQAFYAAPVGQGASFLGHTPLYQPHHWLVYALRPNYRSGRFPVRHNSYGFRGAEFSVEKPSNVYRIVALGASETYCTQVTDDAQTYPARLAFHLQQRYPGVNIEVINAGVPGYTSAENLINLEVKVLDLSPNLLIPLHTHNDIHPRRQPVFRGDYTGYRKIWSSDVTPRERLFRWSALLRVLGIRLGLWRPENIYKYTTTLADQRPDEEAYVRNFSRSHSGYFRRNLRSIVYVAQGHGVDVLLPTAAYDTDAEPDGPYRQIYQRGMREHMQVVKDVAGESGAGFFDFAAVMPATTQYFADAVHVNAAGADLQARLFAQAIVERGYIARWLKRNAHP